MLTYDSRSISALVYENLNQLKQSVNGNAAATKEQKNQAVEIYSYTATWGLLRLKAEEYALKNQPHKQSVVKCFFKTLSRLAFPEESKEESNFLCDENALKKLSDRQQLGASEYLGLTGLGLQVAREFAFWAEALYPKENKSNSNSSTPGGVS